MRKKIFESISNQNVASQIILISMRATVAILIQLRQAVATWRELRGYAYADSWHLIRTHFSVCFPVLTYECPRGHDCKLRWNKNYNCKEQSGKVYAKAIIWNIDSFIIDSGFVDFAVETEFVSDLDRLHQQHVFLRNWCGSTSSTPSEWNNRSKFVCFSITLNRLTSRHTGCYEGTELNNFGWWKLESIKMWQ